MQPSSGAATVLEQLNSKGFEAYLVGGCVRDYVMNRPCADYDVTTNALPEQLLNIFSGYRLLTNGIKHGTVTVLTPDPIEVTTYRVDGKYTDSRHPDGVTFTSCIKDDLARRDFTVNAMAYSPKQGFADPFNGTADIKNKVLRAVGNAQVRFNEDALRILRGVRFCSQLCFDMEPATAVAAKQCACGLKMVSAERKYTELAKTLMGKNAGKALTQYADIIFSVIPELAADKQYYFTACGMLGSGSLAVRWAVLLGATHSSKILRNLKADEKTVKTVQTLINNRDTAVQSEVQIKYLLRDLPLEEVWQLLEYWQALGRDVTKVRNTINGIIGSNQCYSLSALKVNGQQVKQLGFSGKEIGQVLNFALDAVIRQHINNDENSIFHYIKTEWKQ